MKTHYPYFFIKFSKDNLSPLEPIYTNSWKKNFLKNCPLKGKSSSGELDLNLEPDSGCPNQGQANMNND